MMPAGVAASADQGQVVTLLSFIVLPLLALAVWMVWRFDGRVNGSGRLRFSGRLAILGMLSTAGVHLALVPEHLTESPFLGVSFLLAGVALIGLAIAATTATPYWRVTAALLIGAMVVGYGYTRVTGLEAWDHVGLLTKAIELATLALLVRPTLSPLRSRYATAGAGSGA